MQIAKKSGGDHNRLVIVLIIIRLPISYCNRFSSLIILYGLIKDVIEID